MRKVPITPRPAVLEFRLSNNWHVLTPVLTCGLAHSFSTFGRIGFWYWRVCYLSWQFQPCKGGGACLPAILSQASDREIDGGREGFRTKSYSWPWYLGWRGWRLGACQVRALRALFEKWCAQSLTKLLKNVSSVTLGFMKYQVAHAFVANVEWWMIVFPPQPRVPVHKSRV